MKRRFILLRKGNIASKQLRAAKIVGSRRFVSCLVLVTFLFNLSVPYSAHARIVAGLELPTPSQLVMSAGNGSLPVLKGLKLNPQNPLQIDFIIDTKGKGTVGKDEAQKLIKYFLAALAVPKEDIWVNLSPYEQNRIVPQTLGLTDLGKDLLGQDYILKQLASSLTYPESATGKQYWNMINGVGANNHSPATNNFNKVWIIPDKSSVYENNDTALISESRMAVKTEEDYLACRQAGLAMNKNNLVGARHASPVVTGGACPSPTGAFKKYILPLIEKEVNEGANFANLRQIYNSLVLATWFKQKFFNSFYRHYINRAKINGITIDDKTAKEKIYNLYIEAFHGGVYNYVKTDRVGANNYSPVQKITKRQYFSGGFAGSGMTVPLGPATTNGDTVVEARLTPEGLGTASDDHASFDGQAIVKQICDFRNQASEGYDRDLSRRLQTLKQLTPEQMERLPLAAADILGVLDDLATIDGVEHDMHMDPRPQYRDYMIKRFCRAAVAMAILHYLSEDKRAELLANDTLRPHFETAVRYFIKAFPRVYGVGAALVDAFLNNGGYAIMETFGVWDRVRHGGFGSSNSGDVSRKHHALLHRLAEENDNFCLYGSGHFVSTQQYGIIPAPLANATLKRHTLTNPAIERKFVTEVLDPLIAKLGETPGASKAKIGDGTPAEIRDVLRAANIFWVAIPAELDIDDAHASWSQFAIHLFCHDFDGKPLGQKFQDLVHEAVELACKQDLKGWAEADAVRAHRLAENYVQSLEWLAYGEFFGTGPGRLNDDVLAGMSVAEMTQINDPRKHKIIADRIRYILLNYAHDESYYLDDAMAHHEVWGKILEKFSSFKDFSDLGIDVTQFNPFGGKGDKNGITAGEWVSLLSALSRTGRQWNENVLERLIGQGRPYIYFQAIFQYGFVERGRYAPDNLRAALFIAKMEAQRWQKSLVPRSFSDQNLWQGQVNAIRQSVLSILGDLATINVDDPMHMNPEHMSYVNRRYMRARIADLFLSTLSLDLQETIKHDPKVAFAIHNAREYSKRAERLVSADLMRVSVAAPVPRAATSVGTSSRGWLPQALHDEVNNAMGAAAERGDLVLLSKGIPGSIKLSNVVEAGEDIQARVDGVMEKLQGIEVNISGYMGRAYHVDLGLLLSGYNVLCAKTELAKQGHGGLRRNTLYLILPNGLDDLAKMSDRELSEMLLEEMIEVYARSSYPGNIWDMNRAELAHRQAKDIIIAVKDRLERAVGGENFTGMETKVSGSLMPMELKGTDFSQLSGLEVEIISIHPVS